jgi:aspartyl-tRNA(Asn)/glutamyl-tRNA(Gln) amidotransferase subunit B
MQAITYTPVPSEALFYPDQPVNYQRTAEPSGTGGHLAGVRVRELHLEEDPGALDPANGTLDLNRAGVALLEIVTEPDLKGPDDAEQFLDELRTVLEYLQAWNRAAGLKADVNVSIAGGERAEVKNVHSSRGVVAAIGFEESRMRRALAAGERLPRETRGFDETSGTTRRLRGKESFEEYRYIADPDLPTFALPAAALAAASAEEPPLTRRARLAWAAHIEPAGFSPILRDRALVEAYELTAARVPPAFAFGYFLRDIRAELDFRNQSFAQAAVAAEDILRLVEALHDKRITPHVATRILRHALDRKGTMGALLEGEIGAAPSGDALGTAVAQTLSGNEKAVRDFRQGKTTAFNFLLGQLLRALAGRAKPEDARRALEEALGRDGKPPV